MKPKISKNTRYDIERYDVDGVGIITGEITVSDSLSFPDESPFKGLSVESPLCLMYHHTTGYYFDLDYERVAGLPELRGKITGNLNMPEEIPFLKGHSRNWIKRAWQSSCRGPNKRSKAYKKSIQAVYRILEDIVAKESGK